MVAVEEKSLYRSIYLSNQKPRQESQMTSGSTRHQAASSPEEKAPEVPHRAKIG